MPCYIPTVFHRQTLRTSILHKVPARAAQVMIEEPAQVLIEEQGFQRQRRIKVTLNLRMKLSRAPQSDRILKLML